MCFVRKCVRAKVRVSLSVCVCECVRDEARYFSKKNEKEQNLACLKPKKRKSAVYENWLIAFIEKQFLLFQTFLVHPWLVQFA